MSWLNPIIEDYKLLLVFRNMGLKMLQQLGTEMEGKTYNPFFKNVSFTEKNELFFSYLEHNFKTQIELFFNHSKMPKSAVIATYHLQQHSAKGPEEVISYAFDLNYNINNIYTLENFAENYLIEFHQNLKKNFSDNHMPFPINISSK
jgi:hypothetical protein